MWTYPDLSIPPIIPSFFFTLTRRSAFLVLMAQITITRHSTFRHYLPLHHSRLPHHSPSQPPHPYLPCSHLDQVLIRIRRSPRPPRSQRVPRPTDPYRNLLSRPPPTLTSETTQR